MLGSFHLCRGFSFYGFFHRSVVVDGTFSMTSAIQPDMKPTLDQLLPADQVPFDRMRETFQFAMENAGHVDLQRTYAIAGYPVRVRVVGATLANQIEKALAHLQSLDSTTGTLSIDLWDEDATGVVWGGDRFYDSQKTLVMMRASEDGRFVCEERPQGEHWLDRTLHRIVSCTKSATRRHIDERARPFHRLLATWLNDRGIQFVHSGLVAIDGKGILFAGHGGAGKSTSSIACLRSGLQYLGDDFIGIERGTDGAYIGYSLYASSLLNTDHMRRFPDLVPHALDPFHQHEEKAVFYLMDMFPRALLPKTSINAIALPRVVDATHTSFKPASKVEALLAIAPTSIMSIPVPTSRAFHVLAQLVETVPTFWLELGQDIDQIPDAIKSLANVVSD